MIVSQCVGLIAMVLATAPLWFSSHGTGDAFEFGFPAIPLFESSGDAKGILTGNIGALILLNSVLLIGFLITKLRSATFVAGIVLLISMLISVVFNQHCFLPWVYQSMLILLGTLALKQRDSFRFYRILLVSIYLFSAFSKFDYQFVHSTGLVMFKTLASIIGMDPTAWPETLQSICVLSFPTFEGLVGLGLLFKATRFVAMWGGIVMHLSLLLILGPWGLDNAASVLVWNMLFMVQLVLLYWPVRDLSLAEWKVPEQDPSDLKTNKTGKSIVFQVMVVGLFLIPVLEKLNAVDHWPAWCLYGPRASRCKLFISEWKAEQLPNEFRKYLREDKSSDFQVMKEFDMAAWSIDSKNVPIYPQDRFQVGVARFLVKKLELERAFKIEIHSTSDWWTGRRKITKLTELSDVEAYANKAFWLNASAD